ncbi:acyl-CoA dehydrogenase family protein [Zhihengliuella salsuginis]|uniref:Acyl-CoA dehydrogenase n=1 Tax=Zhihengliuella salsuginis TaxID=578222 RepID=A0ABQ3GL97_9MICC|nr:acyl-CoA dehydrogenase family protein [Zhihengliuella salsuginis]GHD13918.1 acyl-CoA dehydrogenase [Zhihengliuella salsuginis]
MPNLHPGLEPRVRAVLTDELLAGMRERASGHDESNTFAQQDFDALVDAGYLKAMLPVEQGGAGWGLSETAAAQRLLGAHAPGTALAVNMHLVWAGVVHLLRTKGDTRLDFVADWIADGHVMAFGISEAGNDMVLFDSLTRAEESADGVRFTGLKIFTSLSPAWTRLGVFGKNDAGELVHAFVDRSDPGVAVGDDWDTLGMRASQSQSTRLDGALAPPAWVHTRLPAGPQADALIFGIFGSFLTLTASVYTGIADRALELAAEHPARRRSLAADRTLDQDPDIRWRVAGAGMDVLALDAFLTQVTRDLDEGVDHGPAWFPRLVSLRTRAGDVARSGVDAALKVSGGGQYYRGSELERLYRDVLASLYHPSDAESAHSTVANWLLGPAV